MNPSEESCQKWDWGVNLNLLFYPKRGEFLRVFLIGSFKLFSLMWSDFSRCRCCLLPFEIWSRIFFCFLELRIAVGSVLFENESLWYSGAPASGRSWAGRGFPISDSNLSRHFLDFRLFIVSSSTYNQNILWSSPTSSIVFFFVLIIRIPYTARIVAHWLSLSHSHGTAHSLFLIHSVPNWKTWT